MTQVTIVIYECKQQQITLIKKTIQLVMENFDYIIIGAGSAGCV